MRIRCSSFEDLESVIKENGKRIVMWGTGLIGRIIAPELMTERGIWDNVECYLDNDSTKWGESILVHGREIPIYSPAHISEVAEDAVLFINISRFAEVIRQAEAIDGTEAMDCYILPMLMAHNYCMKQSEGTAVYTKEPKIPKKLHYMWLGGNPIPEHIQKCIDSWKLFCPDYEIIEWNESNYDVAKNRYMKEAYDAKAYGFVPDYARLDILYRHGGIYLDTDVELVRNLDSMLNQNCFCCLEKWQDISFGGMSGAVAGHPTIKRFMDAREELCFINDDGTQNRNTCGFYDTQTALSLGYKICGRTQNVADMNIFAFDYFLPYDYMTGRLVRTENTYSIHWYNGGWMTEDMKQSNERVKREYEDIYRKACNHNHTGIG